MKPDKTTILSREQGTLPDKYWSQFNNNSAQKNYQEQRENILDALTEEDQSLHIISEVKLK